MYTRFVQPETQTLQLSGGDYVVVRKRLNTGERRAALSRMYLTTADGTMTRHPVLYGIHQVVAYLLDWSFKGPDGNKVVIEGRSIDEIQHCVDNLDPVDFQEVRDAIEAHEEAMAKERADAKKTLDGSTNSAATPPSRSLSAALPTTSEASTPTSTP